MIEKYEIKFNQLKEDSNYEYFVVGSPTHLRWVSVVEGDSFQDIWDELVKMGEIDLDKYESDFGNIEPRNYRDLIEDYLKDSNNFFYCKFSWLE